MRSSSATSKNVECYFPNGLLVSKANKDKMTPLSHDQTRKMFIIREIVEGEECDIAQASAEKVPDVSECDLNASRSNSADAGRRSRRIIEKRRVAESSSGKAPSDHLDYDMRPLASKLRKLVPASSSIDATKYSHRSSILSLQSESREVSQQQDSSTQTLPSRVDSNESILLSKVYHSLQKSRKDITELRSQMTDLENLVGRIWAHISNSEINSDYSKFLEDLPIPMKNWDDVLVVNEKLKSALNFKTMTNFLVTIGGHSCKDMIRRVSDRLFTNELERKMNWTGAKGKMRFGDLKIAQAILEAGNKTNKNWTYKDVQNAITTSLRNASDRHGGRQRRATMATVEIEVEDK